MPKRPAPARSVDGEKTARSPRFVTTSGDSRTLDETALARARKVAGLKGYVTNIPAAIMPTGQVISSYHDLWHVEQSFRMSKTDLQARPIFARTRDAIEAHLTIAFTSRATSRTVQNRTDASIRKVLRTLRPLRSATIEINGTIRTYQPAINDHQRELLDALTTPAAAPRRRVVRAAHRPAPRSPACTPRAPTCRSPRSRRSSPHTPVRRSRPIGCAP